MLLKELILNFYLIIQVTNIIKVTYAGYENYVAFQCGRPTLISLNDLWIPDYKQDCLTDAKEIVAFCKRTFPNQNISSAEPAMEKVQITKWCDFDRKDCDVNIEIRPFKCLEFTFQSDALTLPKDCRFGHLGGSGECKIYKDWVTAARKQCSINPNWHIRSYGMLFQCLNAQKEVIPMTFRGVEFVCCPKINVKIGEQVVYNHYLLNGVLESEEQEDKTYDEALKELKHSESSRKNDVINDFKNGENDLKKLWITDPKLAKLKENNLISQFKLAYKALEDQFISNREQLLDFHDDRRKFLFTTKIHAAMQHLNNCLKKTDVKKMEIIEAMKPILDLLMIRKREIIEERFSDQTLGSRLISRLSTEQNIIEQNVTDLFNRLNQVRQYKDDIKQYLVTYLMKKFPEISFQKIVNKENPQKDQSKLGEIISQYKYNPDVNDGKLDTDKVNVHYDLGLDDKDQEGHYGNTEQKFIFDHNTMEKQFGDKKLLLALVFATLITAFIILSIGSLIIMYRHRPTLFTYTKTKSREEHRPGRQMMQGFGIESTGLGKHMFNGYENPTYKVAQTTIDAVPTDIVMVHNSESHDDNLSSPLLKS